MLRRRGAQDQEASLAAGDASSAGDITAAARMSRRERRELRTRTAAAADLAARVARAHRRLAQATEAFPDHGPASAIPATPPMAHPTPNPDELPS